MTDAMAANADGLVATARIRTPMRGNRLKGQLICLPGLFRNQERPTMAARRAPIIWPPTGTGTDDSPMRELEALARRMENTTPGFWAVNVVAGFSFADCRDAGLAFSIIADSRCGECEGAFDELCELAWELRYEGLPKEREPLEALADIAAASPNGPALLVEPSDNIGGGAPGDGTGILRALLETGQDNAAVIINDPEAVEKFCEINPGESLALPIGGKGALPGAGPITLEAELVSTSDGEFSLEDKNSTWWHPPEKIFPWARARSFGTAE